MATIAIELAAAGYFRKGSAIIDYETVYDVETNQTTVTFGSCRVSCLSIGGGITYLHVNIGVAAADLPESTAVAKLEMTGGPLPLLTVVPKPATVTVQHGYDDVEKSIVITFYVRVTISGVEDDPIDASGSTSETVETGLASIVHLGDQVGILYVALGGAWHPGLIYAAKDGQFHIGIGHIFLVPDKVEDYPELTFTYDEDGNVYLDGVGMTHDNAGNVILSGVTATDDGNGNITIT